MKDQLLANSDHSKEEKVPFWGWLAAAATNWTQSDEIKQKN